MENRDHTKFAQNLEKFTNAHAPSGGESEVSDLLSESLANWGEFSEDKLGSVAYSKGTGPHVLITAHMDEVGFRVQSITANGFIKFVAVGGWWGHTLLAQQVVIKTRSAEKITGVIGCKPVHFLPASQRGTVMDIESMFIDVGASSRREVLEMGIMLGDYIAPATHFAPLSVPGKYVAKAFDNRVGCACLNDVAAELPNGVEGIKLTLGATVQEEVGTRGAATLANVLKPDYAIVLEGTPADDTPGFGLDTSQGIVGNGVQIRMHDPTAIMSPKLVEAAIEAGTESNIPFQLAVRTSGGTDAGRFHLSQTGVPCIVIGVPARYIHTHNSIIDIEDYLAMKDLAVALAKKLAE